MSRLDEVIGKAGRLVEPTRREENDVRRVAEELRRRVEEAAKDAEGAVSVELGGSYAKGTWLKGFVDIDIFVKFSTGLSKKRLEEVGIEIGRISLEGHRWFLRYSEHPYVEGVMDGIKVNVVACYNVAEGRWQSAADRSPYHTKLILSRFDDRMRSEVRLLKRFMRGTGLYGAEIRTQGFSGYVCEVLILKYGSFRGVLEAASKFREGEFISIKEVGEEVKKLVRTPLIILDPVDPARNLGAAISLEKAASLVLASKAFLEDPRIVFFTGRESGDIHRRLERSPLLGSVLVAVFRHEPRMVDILWGQLKRSERKLAGQLSKAGFNVLRSASVSDEGGSSGFVFLLESLELPKAQVKIGPKVEMGQDVETFLKRNQKRMKILWVGRDWRVYGLGERRYYWAAELLEALLAGKVSGSGVAPGLKREVEASSKILLGSESVEYAGDRRWLLEGLWKVVSTDEYSFGSG
ncbi:MAG: CCA tRNA nucleotidyltransferase [Thaumarchaeota archaeon]|nr:CCA tRNA nucleotidyltransferase [Nitrososphaerota archaeon]MCL5318899.1 CCA tRNA nucleotidyltransferase [Nitrososphaerota archaeon]